MYIRCLRKLYYNDFESMQYLNFFFFNTFYALDIYLLPIQATNHKVGQGKSMNIISYYNNNNLFTIQLNIYGGSF